MGDSVIVDQGDNSTRDAAVLLLAAAQELDLDPSVVVVDTTGPSGARFSAPEEVVKKAGLKAHEEEAEEVSERLDGPTVDYAEEQAAQSGDDGPAKKTTAKKTAAKKSATSK